jgi:hypothetical protein
MDWDEGRGALFRSLTAHCSRVSGIDRSFDLSYFATTRPTKRGVL